VTFDAIDSLLVFPRLGQLTPAWRRWQDGIESGAGKSSRRRGLLEGDFYGLRDWRSGDSRRWLHWRTSARRQAPVVRQFEQQRDQGLAILLELWRPATPTAADFDSVEIAVSFVATIVADLCRAGGRRLCVAGADEEPWIFEGPASAALLDLVMRRLATSEASAADRLPQTIAKALERIRRNTQVLVVSTRPVDLERDARFDSVRKDGRLRKWLSKQKTVDTSSSNVSDFFQVS
jgi:uncharacterized protein (DUF58 family)